MKKYILENNKRVKNKFKEYHLFDKPVYILNKLPDNVDLSAALENIQQKLPRALTGNFENIYIGEFDDFHTDGKQLNAKFKDGSIYLSSWQDDEADIVDDIVHEIAHSLEKSNYEEIYGDEAIEKEFLAKRKSLYHLLPLEKRANLVYFLNPNYDTKFDMYLYQDLGYDFLRSLIAQLGLFYSPYAITSLKEYWANGFENYILRDRQKLKDVSPLLYNKIREVIEFKEEEASDL